MASFKAHKVVSVLPSVLEPSSVYFVRVGLGFDIFVTNENGLVSAYPLNPPDLTGKVDGEGITSIKSLTQTEYDALPQKNDTTLYFIKKDPIPLTEVTGFSLVQTPLFYGNNGEIAGSILEVLGQEREIVNSVITINNIDYGLAIGSIVLTLDNISTPVYTEVTNFIFVQSTNSFINSGDIAGSVNETLGSSRIAASNFNLTNVAPDAVGSTIYVLES